jgi:nucleotide-binding universal stress UspA family protein
MKHLGVLIDFSAVCLTSVAFAKNIAKLTNAKITLIHALDEKESQRAKVEARFKPYVNEITGANLQCSIDVAFGDYETEIPRMLGRSDIDLVVIGTHGIRGIKQFLFGSNILRLIQKLQVPALVVQKKSPIIQSKSSKILLPISPHKNFKDAVLQTIELAKLFNAKVIVYGVFKSTEDKENLIGSNIILTCKEFKKSGVAYELIEEGSASYTFNYGKEVIQYASDHDVEFISIMSQVSSVPAIMGKAESQGIILNKAFIPVLCINKQHK